MNQATRDEAATAATAQGPPLSPAAAMVVTSLTLTEAETSVHLPYPTAKPESHFEVADVNANLQKPAVVVAATSGDHNGHPEGGGFPSAVLTCRPNSHPFKERTLFGVQQQVKIGRSVARSRPADSNAIFDCKVLSRNHALLWYRDGKFFLQDTKSSNGTFVNNSRLSKGAEESEPREICSGDVLQFGVDVQENTKKLTHGCIIATVRLFLPDGKEAKASPTIVSSSASTSLPPQDLYQLNQYIQEALVREQMLETKLAMLQRLVGQTNQASDEAWKSLIDEDRLLTRVEILESQLSTYGKGMTEDKLREETRKLMEEKEVYQETAKMTLKKLVDEKLEAVKKTKELEKNLSNLEDEFSLLKELRDKDVEENRELAAKVTELSVDLEQARSSADVTVDSSESAGHQNDITSSVVDEEAATSAAMVEIQQKEPLDVSLDSVGTVSNDEERLLNTTEDSSWKDRLEVLERELTEYKASYDQVLSCNREITCQLEQVQERLEQSEVELRQKDSEVLELKERNEKNSGSESELRSQVTQLLGDQQTLLAENEELKVQLGNFKHEVADYERKVSLNTSTSSSLTTDATLLERSLHEAEAKISELLKIKERFAEVDAEKTNLAMNLSELEEEMDVLSTQTRTATACSIVPLVLLVLAVMVAYLPALSSLFGTVEKL